MVNANMPDGQKLNLNIDINALSNMKCYCGNQTFVQLFNLRYVPPLMCGRSQGATLALSIYSCSKCGQKYKEALPQDEVMKLAKPMNGSEKESGEDENKVQLP